MLTKVIEIPDPRAALFGKLPESDRRDIVEHVRQFLFCAPDPTLLRYARAVNRAIRESWSAAALDPFKGPAADPDIELFERLGPIEAETRESWERQRAADHEADLERITPAPISSAPARLPSSCLAPLKGGAAHA